MKLKRFGRYFPSHTVRDVGRLLGLCVLVGVVAGFGAVAFYCLLDLGKHFFLGELAGYHPAGPGGEASAKANYYLGRCMLALGPDKAGDNYKQRAQSYFQIVYTAYPTTRWAGLARVEANK